MYAGLGRRNELAAPRTSSCVRTEFYLVVEYDSELSEHRWRFVETSNAFFFCFIVPRGARRGDFKRAKKQLADCRTAADGLLPLIHETPRLRMGSFSCSMEVRAVQGDTDGDDRTCLPKKKAIASFSLFRKTNHERSTYVQSVGQSLLGVSPLLL